MTVTVEYLERGSHTFQDMVAGKCCLVEAASVEAESTIIGTAGTPELEERRSWLLADWMVHRYLPLWLRAAGMEDRALSVEGLPTITSRSVWRECRAAVSEATKPARQIRAEWREKITAAVRAEFAKRAVATAVAAAVATATAAGVAAGVAAAVAVAVATAVAVGVATATATAVAAAVAVAAATAVAVATATAADYWGVYSKVREAVTEKLRAIYREKLGDTATSSFRSGLDLLDALIALS